MAEQKIKDEEALARAEALIKEAEEEYVLRVDGVDLSP